MVEDLDHRVASDDVQLELARLMRVSPSPAFVARVRTHLATQPAIGKRWEWVGEVARAQWGAALAVVMIVSVAYWWPMPKPEPVSPDVVMTRNRAQPPSLPARADVLNAKPAPIAVRVSRRVGHERPRATPVLVSTNEAEGLRLFVAAVHDGLIDTGDLPVSAPVGELASLDPIAWQPLVPAAGLEEEQQ